MIRKDYTPGELVPGTIYRVIGKVASGGMGALYDVEDTSVGKRYVLKALHPDLCDRKDLTRRMQAEARTLGRLAHVNIVEVMTAGATAEDPPRPFFVMERLEGQSLRAVLNAKGALELHHVYPIMLELLAALDHAHAHGVVHRDVKPDNVFLHAGRGVTIVKLLDFGIMRILGRQGETAGRFVGTWRYAAPEQLRGETATPETDMYTAGLVLFEMLVGHGPFDDAGDERQVGHAHIKREAPRIATMRSVPPALDALVASALAKDPTKRPRSAHAFAAALRAIVNDAPHSVAPAATTLRVPADEDVRAWRSRVIAIAAMAGLAIVCVAAVLMLRMAPPPRGPSAASANDDVRSGIAPLPATTLAPPLFDEIPDAPDAGALDASARRDAAARPRTPRP